MNENFCFSTFNAQELVLGKIYFLRIHSLHYSMERRRRIFNSCLSVIMIDEIVKIFWIRSWDTAHKEVSQEVWRLDKDT